MEPPGARPREALDSYLSEVANCEPLSPAEENADAKRIAELRADYWRALLSYPPYVDPIIDLLSRELKEPPIAELELVRATARAFRDRHTKENEVAHLRARDAAARVLTWSEPEPATADLVRDEVERVRAGAIVGAVIPLRRPPSGSAPFERYVRDVRRALRNYERAKRAFVEANLRLVISVAKHYNFGVLSLTDLIQEGNLGLMKAVDRFDHRRGTRFSTFAVWWIRHKITRGVANHGRTIRLPVHVTVDNLNLRKASRRLRMELGRDPTDVELAKVTDMSVERVGLTLRAIQSKPVSANAPVHSEGASQVQDLLPAEDAGDTYTRVEDQADCERMRAAMSSLPQMERDILRRRFGLSDGEEHTLAEIGEVYHLSRERIRQLQNRALKRLRVELEAASPAA
jgi:RNA polymerase primary sigma factor